MSPAPGVRHQRASFRLHVALDAAARAVGAPVEILEGVNVVLPSGLVVPDLVVADAGATADDPVTVDIDAVQLVVELVSPATAPWTARSSPCCTPRPPSRTSGAWSSTPPPCSSSMNCRAVAT
ncbi:hypothetical protein ACFQV4_06180 [Streptomyces thermocarboxydus]